MPQPISKRRMILYGCVSTTFTALVIWIVSQALNILWNTNNIIIMISLCFIGFIAGAFIEIKTHNNAISRFDQNRDTEKVHYE